MNTAEVYCYHSKLCPIITELHPSIYFIIFFTSVVGNIMVAPMFTTNVLDEKLRNNDLVYWLILSQIIWFLLYYHNYWLKLWGLNLPASKRLFTMNMCTFIIYWLGICQCQLSKVDIVLTCATILYWHNVKFKG